MVTLDSTERHVEMTVQSGTYVYCLVQAPRRPTLPRSVSGPAGLGRARLLDVGHGRWLVVADAPASRFGEDAINRRLSDIEWVARAAVAHEHVIESFIGAPAVLPMKLFTIFASDERALDQVQRDRRRIDAVLRRVKHHHEWGIRLVLDRARAIEAAGSRPSERTQSNSDTAQPRRRAGVDYLKRKKAQRDVNLELSERASERVAELFDDLRRYSRSAKRRVASDLPVKGGPLLLDAAFLVPASRARRFRASAAKQARVLKRDGYHMTLTGPWPPYSFIED